MTAWYNEIDPFAAEWLRNLIAAGHIAPGVVDTRDIRDVRPDELRGFTQCHFFAGIGVWSLALRRAGWPDDQPVWTGSCPCQPFSAAGRRKGTADERHLWPSWFWLIEQCRPDRIFGEQVASPDGIAWLDSVCADLEASGYAVGAVDLPAAGVGAPHIRQRAWFVADAGGAGSGRDAGTVLGAQAPSGGERIEARRVAHELVAGGEVGVLGDAERARLEGHAGHVDDGHEPGRLDAQPLRPIAPAGMVSGAWAGAELVYCRDGKYRPVEPIALKMVDGSTESLGRLRPEAIDAITEEVTNAFGCSAVAREALRDVFEALSAEAPERWSLGGLCGLHEAPFLLAFLRQLTDQGWPLAQGVLCASEEASQDGLRVLRLDDKAARAPHKRGLDRQQPVEYPDALRVLPPILARHAQASWGEAFDRNAADAFPLISGASSRVRRLRAYGNAIVADAAEAFVAAYMSARA